MTNALSWAVLASASMVGGMAFTLAAGISLHASYVNAMNTSGSIDCSSATEIPADRRKTQMSLEKSINFCQQKLCFVSILLDASETRDPKTKQNKQTNEKKERKKE